MAITGSVIWIQDGGRWIQDGGRWLQGGGHASLKESVAVLGLSKKSFMSTEKRISEWWWSLLDDSIKKAGAAEKCLVIFNARYTLLGSASNHRYSG